VAQTVWKRYFEPLVEPHFHRDSYGYRPGKSALDAVEVTRRRCWKYDWVLEFDIKGLFDNIDFELLMKTVRHHTKERWLLLYVERWLKAPFQKDDGTLVERTKGTPQGGVASPVLANLFLHYVFDLWMKRNYPLLSFCRYADDGVVHCRTESEARALKKALEQRFRECKLELHPEKTRIVYCKSSDRRKDYPVVSFDFLGFTFLPRAAKRREGKGFTTFSPGVSNAAGKDMRQQSRRWRLHRKTELSLEEISRIVSPIVRGWINYYARFYKSALYRTLDHLNIILARWAMRKYKRLRGRLTTACRWLGQIAKRQPQLFPHWQLGVRPAAG